MNPDIPRQDATRTLLPSGANPIEFPNELDTLKLCLVDEIHHAIAEFSRDASARRIGLEELHIEFLLELANGFRKTLRRHGNLRSGQGKAAKLVNQGEVLELIGIHRRLPAETSITRCDMDSPFVSMQN